MLSEKAAGAESRFLISRAAHVVERTGLAMAGAMGGTFVAAYLARASTEPFEFGRVHCVDGSDRHDRILSGDRYSRATRV